MKNKMTAMLAAVLMLGSAMFATSAAAANKGTITIGTHNWPENIAVANMWKVIFEKHGYTVNLVDTLKAAAYSGVANGDLDIGLEVWMPETDKQYYERYKDSITLHDAWYRGTRIGLVVPQYVKVDSIANLNASKQDFEYKNKPTIIGIESGSSIMGATREAIKDYGLDFNLLTSSSPAMTATLSQAIAEHKPIVVTLWSPHWTFAEFKLKYLDDPKGVYGKTGHIQWMSGNDFSDQYPQLSQWLDRWDMNDKQLGGLMNMIRSTGNPAKSAAKWVSDNQSLVKSWLKVD